MRGNLIYHYLIDATGNCVGVVCAGNGGNCGTGVSPVNWTRMDAFGNLIAEIFRHEEDESSPLPSATLDCSDANTACASTQPATLDKPLVIAGPYQYHGSQGYEADVVMPTSEQAEPGATRSTNFMHVGFRYYEPATGRFLSYDPSLVDPTPFSWGQHNRWVYSANDPVNAYDNSGNSLSWDWGGAALVLTGLSIMIGAGVMLATAPAFAMTELAAFFFGLGTLLAGLALMETDCATQKWLEKLARYAFFMSGALAFMNPYAVSALLGEAIGFGVAWTEMSIGMGEMLGASMLRSDPATRKNHFLIK